MKKIIGTLIVVVAAAIVFFIWKPFEKPDPSARRATTVSTAVIKRGNLTITVNSTGVVQPILTVELKSKASGEIIELPVEEGDHVTKGQLIARLDATTARNDFEQAQADLEVAEIALQQAVKQTERQEQMYKQGLISELDYDAALLAREQSNSALVAARTKLENARERLSDTVIKSPMDGIVLKKFVEKGQIIASGISAVSGGTTIATIADLSRACILTSVDEVDIGQIVPGQKAAVVAESYPDKEFQGEVLRIHPLAKTEQNVTVFEVTTQVDNSENLLMAGMNANVEITAGFKEDVLLAPREALTDARSIARLAGSESPGAGPGLRIRQVEGGQPSAGQPIQNKVEKGPRGQGASKMVIVVNNGQQEPRPVEIGISNFEQAEIISGIREGDTVLTTVTSKALKDREEMMERMRGWNQIPGMEKKRK